MALRAGAFGLCAGSWSAYRRVWPSLRVKSAPFHRLPWIAIALRARRKPVSRSSVDQLLTQNWHGLGESDCLIKTKHCDGQRLMLTQHDLLDGQFANTNSLQFTSSGDSSMQVANMVHLANNSSSSASFSLGLNRSLTNISILGNLTANSSLSSSLDETSGGPVNIPLLTASSSLSSSPENFDALEEILKGPSLTVEKLLPVERCGFASDNPESGDFHSWVRADNAITDICTI